MIPANHIEIAGIACERQDRLLFQNLSFQLGGGELARIHGLNGSGKSSLLKIITGLLHPLAGQVNWNHTAITEQPGDYHQALTWLGHKPAIKPELTVMENLKMLLGLRRQRFDRETTQQALAVLSLEDYASVQAGYLSAGQQRRIALARLWLEPTALWVLDEPYTALDTKAVSLVNGAIEQTLKRGGIVIMTSHQETKSLDVRAVNVYLET